MQILTTTTTNTIQSSCLHHIFILPDPPFLPFKDKLLSKMEVDEGEFPFSNGSFSGISGSGLGSDLSSDLGSDLGTPIAANSKGEPLTPEDDEVSLES